MTNDFSKPGEKGAGSPPRMPGSDQSSAEQQMRHLKNEVADDVEAARETISRTGEKAASHMKEAASDKVHFAAHQVGGIGEALEKVGDELQDSDQPHVGRYARKMGSSVRDLARRMEGKDAGEIARMAEDFGRRQPLAFIGMAALAGLTASRFLNASAKTSTAGSKPGPAGTTTTTTPPQAATSTTGQGGDTHG